MHDRLKLRLASWDEVDLISKVITEVSEGFLDHLFLGMKIQEPRDLLELAFLKKIAPFELNNVNFVIHECKPVGMLFGYGPQEASKDSLVRSFFGEKKFDELSNIFLSGVKDAYWINTIWISPEMRNQGLGTLLLDCSAYIAEGRGLKKISLHCWADNEKAISFYERNQFEVVEQKDALAGLEKRHPKGSLILERDL